MTSGFGIPGKNEDANRLTGSVWQHNRPTHLLISMLDYSQLDGRLSRLIKLVRQSA